VLIALLLIDGIATVGYAIAGSGFQITFLAINIALQVCILGTFDSIKVQRTSHGKASVTRYRRIGFYSMAPEKLRWQDSHQVGVVASHSPGLISYGLCLYLLIVGGMIAAVYSICLIPLGLIPAAVFYWVYLHPERYDVRTMDVYGGVHDILYRTTCHDQAVDVASTIATATGLKLSTR
jgi:hypothetical protein